MAIPASGPISLGMLQNEFRGTSPSRMGEYYRNNVLVKDITENRFIPGGGPIRLSNFRGASYTQGFDFINIQNGGGENLTVAPGSTPDPRRTILVFHRSATGNTGLTPPTVAIINGAPGREIYRQNSTVRDDGQSLTITAAAVPTGTNPSVYIPGGAPNSAWGIYAVYGHYFVNTAVVRDFSINTDGGDVNLRRQTLTVNIPAGSIFMYVSQANGGGPTGYPNAALDFYQEPCVSVGLDTNPPIGNGIQYGYNGPNQPAQLIGITFSREF